MSDSPSFMIYPYRNPDTGQETGYVLLNSHKSMWIVVNNSGLEIAKYLDKGEHIDEVASRLVKKYGISADVANADVSSVFKLLSEQHFFNEEGNGVPVRTPSLSTTFFHLTNRCNLSCLQCYLSCPETCDKDDIPASVMVRLIDELVECGGRGVTFSGGEPLLYPEIKKILNYANSKVKMQLLTNGTLINREWASFLCDMDIYVQISIDGSRPEIHDLVRGNGNFEKAIRAVKFLQEVGLGKRLNFSTTVTNQNINDLANIITLAERLSVPSVRFLPLRQIGTAKNNWDSVGSEVEIKDYEGFYQYTAGLQAYSNCSIEISCGLAGLLLSTDGYADDIWCPVGNNLVVWINGDVYPCVLLMREEFRLGNAFQGGLSGIVKSSEMAKITKILSCRRTEIKKCSQCNWRNLCQSGCMGQAMDHKGSIWDTDNFCDYRKKAYENAFVKILRKHC